MFPELHKSLSFHGWDLGTKFCAAKARFSLSEAYQVSCILPLLGDSLLDQEAPETLRDSQCEQAQGFQGAVALGDSLLEGKDSIKDETYASNISTVQGAIRMSTEWPLSCEAHSPHQTQTQSINYRQRAV